jgi:hypothetical protein
MVSFYGILRVCVLGGGAVLDVLSVDSYIRVPANYYEAEQHLHST